MNKKKIITGIVVIFLIGIGAMTYLYFDGIQAPSDSKEEIIVSIESGTTSKGVLDKLEENGLLKNRLAADICLKLGNYNTLQANTYVLNQSMDLETILTIINTGDYDYLLKTKFTIKEGATIPENAKVIAEALDVKTNDVLKVWGNREYLQSLMNEYWFITDDILATDIIYPLEGYLAAETYFITDPEPTIELATKHALDQMAKNLKGQEDAIKAMKMTPHEFLTFASIVQSEAGDSESAMIAGVFINRLDEGMMLQSDVTVNYANQIKTVDVTAAHLSIDSRYNTYKYAGLPVGPICSPSVSTIDACLNYTKNDFLYFVADVWGENPTGKVYYSKTFAEHNKKANELKAKR